MLFPVILYVAIWALFMPVHFWAKARGKKPLSLLFKGIPTLLCAALAGLAFLGNADLYAKWIFAGLCVCTLADILLDIRFEVGGTLFFLGHVLYVVALSQYRTLSWWCLTVAVLALAGLWFFASHYTRGISQWHIVAGVLIYCLALSGLLGFSLPLPFLAPSVRSTLAAMGAAAFVISDMTLCHNTVRQKPVRWHYGSLGIYYTAQWLLALSTKA